MCILPSSFAEAKMGLILPPAADFHPLRAQGESLPPLYLMVLSIAYFQYMRLCWKVNVSNPLGCSMFADAGVATHLPKLGKRFITA